MATPSSPATLSTSPSVQFPLDRTDSDPDVRHSTHSPGTPSSASLDGVPLLSDGQPIARTPRPHTVSPWPSFVSSPLNPNAVAHSSGPLLLSVGSRAQSTPVFNRIASEESQALASQQPSFPSNRASMILYRLAGEEEQRALSPLAVKRQSVLSNSGDSVFTVSYDSKYPSGVHTPNRLIAFPFDPNLHINTPEDDDALHDPSDDTLLHASSGIAIRGFVNVGVLVVVILALLFLFIFYPVWHYAVNGNSPVS